MVALTLFPIRCYHILLMHDVFIKLISRVHPVSLLSSKPLIKRVK